MRFLLPTQRLGQITGEPDHPLFQPSNSRLEPKRGAPGGLMLLCTFGDSNQANRP